MIAFQLTSQNERLLTKLKNYKTNNELLQEQLLKISQKYSDVLEENEELEAFYKTNEVQLELSNAKIKMSSIKHSYERIDVIKLQLLEEVSI